MTAKVLYFGKEIGQVLSDHSMTNQEAVENALGIDLDTMDGAQEARENGCIYAYLDDNGNYLYDFENMQVIWE